MISKKNLSFVNYFFNVIFAKTIAYIGFKFCFRILQTHLEGTVSDIFYLGRSFYFMAKIGKHFANLEKLFLNPIKYEPGPK